EARAYAVARAFSPLLINTVVGFIGPEYLYDGKQIIRAGLEDHFCGKLLGLPMGCDVCYTNRAEADQDDMDALLTLLTAAGVNFVMGVPGADDIMLGYQSTSFDDALAMRDLLQRRPAPEFEAWLARQGLIDEAQRIRLRVMPSRFRALLPAWCSLGQRTRSAPSPRTRCAPSPRPPCAPIWGTDRRNLGEPPLPLAGEGWGGGERARMSLLHAPSLSLPRRRGRGRRSRSPAVCGNDDSGFAAAALS